jgi:hypothetical protein
MALTDEHGVPIQLNFSPADVTCLHDFFLQQNNISTTQISRLEKNIETPLGLH